MCYRFFLKYKSQNEINVATNKGTVTQCEHVHNHMTFERQQAIKPSLIFPPFLMTLRSKDHTSGRRKFAKRINTKTKIFISNTA